MRARSDTVRNALLSRSSTPQTTLQAAPQTRPQTRPQTMPHAHAVPTRQFGRRQFGREGKRSLRSPEEAGAGARARPAIGHDVSRVQVDASRRPAERQPVSEDEISPTTATTRQPPPGGAAAGPRDAGVPAGVPPAPTVRPTGISKTEVDRPTASLGPTYYGSVFAHTLSTGGGTITPDVTIAEKVGVTRDDFNTGFTGVALGTLTWGPSGTAALAGNKMFDNIGTGPINATRFVPGPPGLPALMITPQELHYRVGTGAWSKFADVPMTVTLRDHAPAFEYSYEVETNVNGVASLQEYTGPE